MNISWLTDIHLDHIHPDSRLDDLMTLLGKDNADALLITGDIGEARTVLPFLEEISRDFGRAIYFVLGNHDFFGGWIHPLRLACASIGECTSMEHRKRLHYLTTETRVIELTPSTALIGHDGWGDARSGDYDRSTIELNDHKLINDLSNLTNNDRRIRLNALGDEAATHIEMMLTEALRQYDHVILATHVPPFAEACIMDSQWLPHVVCTAMGQTIRAIMEGSPDKRLTVYCGHTHTKACCRPLPNVEVRVGAGATGSLQVQEMIELLR